MAERLEPDRQIEELYRKLFYPLYCVALKRLSDPSLAEEAVQNTFCIACQKRDQLMASSNPEGWIMNTLKNVIMNMQRTQAKLAVNVIHMLWDSEEATVGSADELDVDTLYGDIADSQDFQLLKQIALEKCSLLEAAQDLGITVEACKKRVQRARKRLQEKLKPDE